MVRRVQNGHGYWICDYTGFPMHSKLCEIMLKYSDKGSKRHQFVNWEAALEFVKLNKYILQDWYYEEQQILKLTGCNAKTKMMEAPGLDRLSHLVPPAKRNMYTHYIDTPAQFQAWCNVVEYELYAVLLYEHADQIAQIVIPVDDGKYWFKQCEHYRFFRKSQVFKVDAFSSLHVQYIPSKDPSVELNQTLLELFGIHGYGKALVTLRSNETSYIPRTRYLNLPLEDFKELLLTKKWVPEPALDPAIQASLNDYEQRASAGALPVSGPLTVMKCPPAKGKELAAVARKRKRAHRAAERQAVVPEPLEEPLPAQATSVESSLPYCAPAPLEAEECELG